MKQVTEKKIVDTVAGLCIEANTQLRSDVAALLKKAAGSEKNARGRRILNQLLENARIARQDRIALCQDTGLPIVFVRMGRDVDLSGIDLKAAINRGVEEGYRKGALRASVVSDPLTRVSGSGFSPAVIHASFHAGKGVRLTVFPKGFGCENKTRLKMFLPTSGHDAIENFVVESVFQAGPDACPPYVVGVGIGGSADAACLLAKEALLEPITRHHARPLVARLEASMLRKINALGIGPMGLGGRTTALAVKILTNPTHIAGLPVCVNISCHVLRSASAVIR